MRPVVGLDQRLPASCPRCSVAIPSAFEVSAAVGLWLIDQPTHPAAERVEHDGAVHLALTVRMVRDAEVHPGSVQT